MTGTGRDRVALLERVAEAARRAYRLKGYYDYTGNAECECGFRAGECLSNCLEDQSYRAFRDLGAALRALDEHRPTIYDDPRCLGCGRHGMPDPCPRCGGKVVTNREWDATRAAMEREDRERAEAWRAIDEQAGTGRDG